MTSKQAKAEALRLVDDAARNRAELHLTEYQSLDRYMADHPTVRAMGDHNLIVRAAMRAAARRGIYCHRSFLVSVPKYREKSAKARFIVPIIREYGAPVDCDAESTCLKKIGIAEKNGMSQYDKALHTQPASSTGQRTSFFELDTEALPVPEWQLYILSWTAKTREGKISGGLARSPSQFSTADCRAARWVSSSTAGLGLPPLPLAQSRRKLAKLSMACSIVWPQR
jgi:hypothetical protein